MSPRVGYAPVPEEKAAPPVFGLCLECEHVWPLGLEDPWDEDGPMCPSCSAGQPAVEEPAGAAGAACSH